MPSVFVTRDSRGRLIRYPSGLVVPAPERRGSRQLPATNHGARYQAENPAPDGPWPWEPPQWRIRAFRWFVRNLMSERAKKAVVHVALAIVFLAICWTFLGCAHRAAPVEVVRVQSHAIDCRLCEMHADNDCTDRGGPRSSKVVEYLDYRREYTAYTPARCENKCMDGNTISHACRQDPVDWIVAEAK